MHRKRKACTSGRLEREQELLRQREAQEEALAAKRARIQAARQNKVRMPDIHTEKKQVWDKERCNMSKSRTASRGVITNNDEGYTLCFISVNMAYWHPCTYRFTFHDDIYKLPSTRWCNT